MKGLCLFGGSFDPVHLGHCAMVEAALGSGGQEELWVVPASIPPHKPGGPIASPEDRLAMARLAFAGRPGVHVSDLEIRRGGISYTVDTIRGCLAERGGKAAIALLLGADSLPELPTWKEWRALLRLCRILVVPRPGFPERVEPALLARLGAPERAALEDAFLAVPPVAISSSEVRRRLAQGLEWTSLVPPEVVGFIRKRGLYRSPDPP